jgi:hypothetical protein
MAMRDPGRPGRNPFFDHGVDAELGDLPAEPDDLDGAGSGDPFEEPYARALPGGPGAGLGRAGVDPLGTLAALVDALQGAQPEATEHLIAAAHELVVAVKTVVDATEAVLAASRAEADAVGEDDRDQERDPFASEPAPARERSGVRRIDLA